MERKIIEIKTQTKYVSTIPLEEILVGDVLKFGSEIGSERELVISKSDNGITSISKTDEIDSRIILEKDYEVNKDNKNEFFLRYFQRYGPSCFGSGPFSLNDPGRWEVYDRKLDEAKSWS